MNEYEDLDVLERELGPDLRRVLRRAAEQIPARRPARVTSVVELEHHQAGDGRSEYPTWVSIDTERSASRPPGVRRWRVIAVAAAVAAIIVGLLVVVAAQVGTDTEVPADRPTTVAPDPSAAAALAAADRFMNAWESGDGVALAALFEPGGEIEIGSFGHLGSWPNGIEGPSTMSALHDWFRAAGFEFGDSRCQLTAAPFGVPLYQAVGAFCSFTYESDLTRHFDRPPLTDNFWFEIHDGMMRSVGNVHLFDAEGDMAYAFEQWVAHHHPDDVDRMYGAPDSFVPRLDPESIGLWERNLGEFIASSATAVLADDPQTMAEYDARVLAICAAHDVEFERARAERGSSDAGAASVSEAAARIGAESLQQLRALRPPASSDDVEAWLSAMEQEIALEAQVAEALRAGDSVLAEQLSRERVDLTHQEPGGHRAGSCPVNLGA